MGAAGLAGSAGASAGAAASPAHSRARISLSSFSVGTASAGQSVRPGLVIAVQVWTGLAGSGGTGSNRGAGGGSYVAGPVSSRVDAGGGV